MEDVDMSVAAWQFLRGWVFLRDLNVLARRTRRHNRYNAALERLGVFVTS